MYVVKICNNSGKFVEWERSNFKEEANRERDIVIAEHDFWPEDVIVEEI